MSSTTSDERRPLTRQTDDELVALYRAGTLRGDDRIALFEILRKRGIDPERHDADAVAPIMNPLSYHPLDGRTATRRELWRILIWAQLAGSLFLNIIGLLGTTLPFLFDDAFDKVTDPQSAHYVQGFGSLLIAETIFLTLFTAYVAYVLSLFKRSSRRFPLFFIGMFCISILAGIIETVAARAVVEGTAMESVMSELELGLIGAVIGGALWIPFILLSKRVKETFVRS